MGTLSHADACKSRQLEKCDAHTDGMTPAVT